MPVLKIICKGHEVDQKTFNDDQEIWIGRDSENDIVLNASYGVSRKHLKVFQTSDQKWKVKCESSLGGLIVESKETHEVVLEDQTVFSLQDFSFQFFLNSDSPELKKEDSPLQQSSQKEFHENIDQFVGEEKEKEQGQEKDQETSQESLTENSQKSSLSGKTIVNPDRNLQAQIVISLPESDEAEEPDEETVILKDQSSWIIGRDLTCDVCIEDRAMSREHLKIERKDAQYFVTDLKSSNGTVLNDENIKSKQAHPLKSGDVLKILDIKIYFDIIDLSFKEEKPHLPVFSPSHNEPASLAIPPVSNVVMDETRITSVDELPSSKKRTFLIVGVLALIFIGIYFSNEQKTKTSEDEASGEEFGLEDQERVKDMYNIAQQLYQAKKFELCMDKIEELHVLTTTEQSLDLEQKCINGKQNLISQMEIKRKKEEQEKIRKLITQNIEECSSKFSTFQSVKEIQNCFIPTLDHEPENFTVTELISKFEIQQMEIQEKQIAQAEYKKRIQTEMNIYNKALALKTSGQVLKAIPAYKKFLERKHPSAITETVEKARQELESMETELNEKISKFMNECNSLLSQKQYKKAHQACKNTLTVLPNHPPALAGMQTSINELNKNLKPIYEEGVLNESLGRVDNAKKFWSEIIEKDIPDGEYAKKSQIKLGKY